MFFDFTQPYSVAEAIVFPEYTYPGKFPPANPSSPSNNPTMGNATSSNTIVLTGSITTPSN